MSNQKLTRFFEVSGTIAGIAGACLLSLNIEQSPFGYVLFLLSCLCLAGHARCIRSHWLLGLQGCFLITNISGIYHWLIAPLMVAG